MARSSVTSGRCYVQPAVCELVASELGYAHRWGFRKVVRVSCRVERIPLTALLHNRRRASLLGQLFFESTQGAAAAEAHACIFLSHSTHVLDALLLLAVVANLDRILAEEAVPAPSKWACVGSSCHGRNSSNTGSTLQCAYYAILFAGSAAT